MCQNSILSNVEPYEIKYGIPFTIAASYRKGLEYLYVGYTDVGFSSFLSLVPESLWAFLAALSGESFG